MLSAYLRPAVRVALLADRALRVRVSPRRSEPGTLRAWRCQVCDRLNTLDATPIRRATSCPTSSWSSAPGRATRRRTASSCGATSPRRCGSPPACADRRRRRGTSCRTRSSRATGRSGATGARRPCARGCCASSPTRRRTRSAGRSRRAPREHRHERLRLAAADGDPVGDRVAAEAEAAELLDLLGRLDERDREVLACRFVAGLTEAETAATLGVPPGTVKSRTAARRSDGPGRSPSRRRWRPTMAELEQRARRRSGP